MMFQFLNNQPTKLKLVFVSYRLGRGRNSLRLGSPLHS
jgi:hypothetical protein